MPRQKRALNTVDNHEASLQRAIFGYQEGHYKSV
jgi:hypothetical protein